MNDGLGADGAEATANGGRERQRRGHPLRVFQVGGTESRIGRHLGELTLEIGGFEGVLGFYRRLAGHLFRSGRRDRAFELAAKGLERLLERGLVALDRARPHEARDRTAAFIRALGRPESDRLGVVTLDAAQNAIGLMARAGLMGRPDGAALGQLAFPGACSSFAVWGSKSEGGRLLHGRNFDLPGQGHWEQGPTVVFVSPARGLRHGYVGSLGADIPGVTAFNEAGLTVTAHSRFHRAVTFRGLSIVDLAHTIAKEARTLADAIALAARHRVASSWGLVVSSARERRALAIEVHAGRVAVDRGRVEDGYFCATNRFQVPAMQPGEVAPSAAWVRYSDGRLAAMRRALDAIEARRPMDLDGACALLSSHEAGDVPGWERATGDCLAQTISLQSVVCDPERELIRVSTGDTPTSRGPWVDVPWRWEGQGLATVEGRPGPCGSGRYREGASGQAFDSFVDAARRESLRAPQRAVREAMERAVGLCPQDPSFRFIAGGLALRDGDLGVAQRHLQAAVETEASRFRRREGLLWLAATAAWRGDPVAAAGARRELLVGLDGEERRGWAGRLDGVRRPRAVGVDLQQLAVL